MTDKVKVIYFTVDGKPEQAEFRSDFPADDVKDCFRSASEAGPNDILKLYNQKGSIINISPKLEENGPDSRYRLEVVATNCDTAIAKRLGVDMSGLEARLQELETKVKVENGDTPSVVYDLRNKVESFREKLEGVEHLSWLGLFKDLVRYKGSKHFYQNGTYLKASEADLKRVWEKFKKMSNVQLTTEVREYLRQPSFDNWQWEDAEMLVLLQQMYIDLDFVSKFHIEIPVLQTFLFEVYKHYNNVPFHNFKHCFCVCQMMYGISWLTDLCSLIGDIDVMIMITATICHDLDHPGYNNAYQVNAKTELALRYNDISPLENHHCAVAFEILEKPHCNIFKNIGPERYKRVREGMIKTILATDMARHNEILSEFKSIRDNIDYSNKKHKDLLMMICIKVSDISNEARPMDVSDPWIDCLLTEFFNQGDIEKLQGLPVAPFMDREKTTKPSSQVGFIGFVLLPLFETLAALFPVLDEHIVEPVRKALKYYTDMVKALEEEKKRKEERQENGENMVKNGETTKMRKLSQTNGSVASQVEAK